jgi:hypothetical protein
MTALRLFAVFVIFVLATIAWVVLGATDAIRTNDTGDKLHTSVGGLLGSKQGQDAPTFTWSRSKGGNGKLGIAGTDIDARFTLDQRKKGLLWYAGYKVAFSADYRVTNSETKPVDATMRFSFPTKDGAYDGFAVKIDGVEVPVAYREGVAVADFPLAAGQTARISTGYTAHGLDEWRYRPTPGVVDVVRDFRLTMHTDFANVDYPQGAVSPTERATPEGSGLRLTWDYASLVSGRPIALTIPAPPNPGPLASRISFFAPVSLLFFFAALILLTATSGIKLHPIHYGFLAAAFFAFHLLLSYLADQIDINVAFLIASAASVVLLIGYLSVVVGRNRALIEIALSQVVFLVLFSYSFFFEGLTGLAITIGSVATLAYFMARTAKVDWDTVFRKAPKTPRYAAPYEPTAPPAPPAPSA